MAKPPLFMAELPAGDEVADHLKQHRPAAPSRWAAQWPFFTMLLMVMLLALLTNLDLPVVLCLALLGMFLMAMIRAAAVRRLEQRLEQVQDWSLLRQHRQALQAVWPLVAALRSMPTQQARAVALLAHNLAHLGAHDAAIVAFDDVIERLPESHPVEAQLRVEQTLALLSADRLADADAMLRRLRSLVDAHPGTPVSAGYHLAELYQQVRTHHFQDAAEARHVAQARLRPLGIEAGAGHGLIALACWKMAQVTGESALHEQARVWWDRATLLLSPQRLADRFEELASLADGVPPLSPSLGTQGVDPVGEVDA